MTVRELLGTLQRLPRDAELLAMEVGCEEYCQREVDEAEWQGAGHTYIWVPGGMRRPIVSPGAGRTRQA
jgi:hypothetical protein